MSESKCPKCSGPLVVKDAMFFWRGQVFSGLVCDQCKGLWDNPADSFLKVAMRPTVPAPARAVEG